MAHTTTLECSTCSSKPQMAARRSVFGSRVLGTLRWERRWRFQTGTYHTCWHPSDGRARGNILEHHGTGADLRTVGDLDRTEHPRPSADHHAVANRREVIASPHPQGDPTLQRYARPDAVRGHDVADGMRHVEARANLDARRHFDRMERDVHLRQQRGDERDLPAVGQMRQTVDQCGAEPGVPEQEREHTKRSVAGQRPSVIDPRLDIGSEGFKRSQLPADLPRSRAEARSFLADPSVERARGRRVDVLSGHGAIR